MTEKEWIHKGRKYYANKEDAIKRKQKGDRVYYDAHLKAYYIVKPRRKKNFGGIKMSGSVEVCPRCGYSWTYNGKLEYRRTCPNCGYVWYKRKDEPTYKLVEKGRMTTLTRRKDKEADK